VLRTDDCALERGAQLDTESLNKEFRSSANANDVRVHGIALYPAAVSSGLLKVIWE
jgi:hypothetical protein